MQVNFKASNYELTKEITELAEKKLAQVGKYLGPLEGAAKAYVELGRAVGNQHTGDIWRAEVNLAVGNDTYRAVSTKAKLDHALHTAVQDVARRVRRARREERSMFRKGGAAVKDFLRGFGKK